MAREGGCLRGQWGVFTWLVGESVYMASGGLCLHYQWDKVFTCIPREGLTKKAFKLTKEQPSIILVMCDETLSVLLEDTSL